MSQDEFTRLSRYVTERFGKIDKQFDAQTARFDRLDSMVDEEERLVMGHQLDRLDR